MIVKNDKVSYIFMIKLVVTSSGIVMLNKESEHCTIRIVYVFA